MLINIPTLIVVIIYMHVTIVYLLFVVYLTIGWNKDYSVIYSQWQGILSQVSFLEYYITLSTLDVNISWSCTCNQPQIIHL